MIWFVRKSGNVVGQIGSEETHGVGVNETRDQEFSFRQVQSLQSFSNVADFVQERFLGYWGIVRGCDLVDSLDQTVVADVDECAGDRVVGTVVDGRDERAGDEERHLVGRGISTSRG